MAKAKTKNTLFPGLPNYTGPNKGSFTLIHHHGPLVEESGDINERVAFINTSKPEHERKTRLEHLVYVPPEVARLPLSVQSRRDRELKTLRLKIDLVEAEYQNALAEHKEKQLKYLQANVKDCKWDECAKTLLFPAPQPPKVTPGSFAVGQKVRFKSWNTMIAQYGQNPSGSIQVDPHCVFAKDMKNLCGLEVTISTTDISSPNVTITGLPMGIRCWSYVQSMFEAIKPLKKKPSRKSVKKRPSARSSAK